MNLPKPKPVVAAEDVIKNKIEPYELWSRAPSPSNMQTVLKSLNPTIDSAVATYAGGASSPIIRSRAALLAAKAVKSFDPSKGANLKTHVMNQLHPLTRYANQAAAPLGPTEYRALQLRDLDKTERELSDELGREPSDLEIADKMGLSVKRIQKIRTFAMPISGFDMPTSENDNDPAVYKSDPFEIWLDYLYQDLDSIDRKILEWKLGRNGKPVLKNMEIARRLKLSPGAITQRAGRIQQRLNQLTEMNP